MRPITTSKTTLLVFHQQQQRRCNYHSPRRQQYVRACCRLCLPTPPRTALSLLLFGLRSWHLLFWGFTTDYLTSCVVCCCCCCCRRKQAAAVCFPHPAERIATTVLCLARQIYVPVVVSVEVCVHHALYFAVDVSCCAKQHYVPICPYMYDRLLKQMNNKTTLQLRTY